MSSENMITDLESGTPQIVAVKHAYDHSIATLAAAFFTTIGSSVFWINLMIKAVGDWDSKSVFQFVGSLMILIVIAYSFARPRIMNNLAIPIYDASSISNAAMCNNIVIGFEQKKKHSSYLDRIKYNCSAPNLTPDLIAIINKILIMVYESYAKIFNRMDDIGNEMGAMNNTMRSLDTNMTISLGRSARAEVKLGQLQRDVSMLTARIDNLEEKVDTLTVRIDNLEEKVDKIDNKLDSIIFMLNEFKFVVA